MKPIRRAFTLVVILLLVTGATVIAAITFKNRSPFSTRIYNPVPVAADTPKVEKGCVFQTVFGKEGTDSDFLYKTPGNVEKALSDALVWMASAQGNDGGWGAGSHYHQEVVDPHAVKSDPATTSMVAMALLRCGNTPTQGNYAANLNKATEFLLAAVEASPENDLNITDQKGTQPQIKLGQNIDVVLTSQFLTNILDYTGANAKQSARIKKCIEKCVAKIQKAQNSDGSFQGSGWAGVLQSSLANNSLESAMEKGIAVDTVILENSRSFQKGNIDAQTGDVKTDLGAGVVLYSVSSTGRASAKEARVAKDKIEEAKKEGRLKSGEKVTADNLRKVGMSEDQAIKYAAAYDINEQSNKLAQQDAVMSGFGSNGGEEFLSYLQTGEGMIMSKNYDWKKWYDNVSGRLLKIQNTNGSWQGHHCITSPVFCTATCLLILSVNNDIEHLLALGD